MKFNVKYEARNGKIVKKTVEGSSKWSVMYTLQDDPRVSMIWSVEPAGK